MAKRSREESEHSSSGSEEHNSKSESSDESSSSEFSCSSESIPKRSRSAYMFFCLEKRSQVAREFPDLHGIAVTKILAERWKYLQDKTVPSGEPSLDFHANSLSM